MGCNYPMKALVKPDPDRPGKKKVIFLPRSTEFLDNDTPDSRLVEIPCGQCIGCRMAYSYQWANRLMLELQDHDIKNCYFVTLTYDDKHLCELDHLKTVVDPNTGELVDGPYYSLRKKDLQDFMKRLRDALGYDDDHRIRFFACGEYGGKTFRPHFHLILFNLRLPENDLIFYKKSKLGYDYHNSKLIAEKWPNGYNVVAPVTWESCCYVARYMLKKQKGDDKIVYYASGAESPFTLCSRKPGIAANYLKRCGDFSKISLITIGTANGVRRFPAPSYLEKLFAEGHGDEEFPAHPEEGLARKELRQRLAKERIKLVEMQTDKDYFAEYLPDEEKRLARKADLLHTYRVEV